MGLFEQDFLRSLLKMSSEAIIVVDDASTILMFSSGAEAIFGYAAAELQGETLSRLMPERFWIAHDRRLAAFAMGTQDSQVMGDRGPVRARRKTGEEFWVEASISKLETPRGLIFAAVLRDITQRLRDEAAVLRSEQRLRMAVQAANLHVFDIDYQDLSLTQVGGEGPFFDRPLRFEDLAADIWCALRPDYRDAAEAAWRQHLDTGAGFKITAPTQRQDGREIWMTVSAEIVRDTAGRPLRIVGALQDATAEKETEMAMQAAVAAAEAANVAKSAFLATMSHEIRTPLNGVLGMAQAMMADELSSRQRERLEIIRQSGEDLLAILNDVLDLSKIEAGRIELEAIAFDLGDLLRGVAATFAALAERKALGFYVDISAAEGHYVGDPTRIRQILYNLISNALKFTSAGDVRVSATHAEGHLRLTVSDTGIGMSSEILANLFHPFVQADATTTRRYGGSGLGLAISRRLAEIMDGELTAASQPGRGSQFALSLPLAKRPEAGPDRARLDPRPRQVQATRQGDSVRLLAAEDNPTNQLVLKTLLHQAGIEPVLVANGRLAVETWAEQSFDVILMDVQMPDLDGPGATRAIRAREAALERRRTPIIGLTANAMAHQVRDYLAAGMDAVVTKPIDVAKLFEVLQAVLEPPNPVG